jgi:hypothetical protein
MTDTVEIRQLQERPGWKPTTSTVGGALIGGAVAQVVIGVFEQFFVPLNPNIAGGLTVLCVALAGYLFPDGGRK